MKERFHIVLNVFALAAMLAVMFPAVSRAETLDFDFQNSGGRTFQITQLQERLEEIYGESYPEMTVVLIETPSPADPKFREQMNILDGLEHGAAEVMQLIYVVADSSGEDLSGYHTSAETARRLAGGGGVFRVRLLTVVGDVYFTSDEPIEAGALRAAVLVKPAPGESTPKTGYICTSPIPKSTEWEISPRNPAGGDRDFNFSVQIDQGETVKLGFNEGRKFEGIPMGERHLIKIMRSGELIESFWFRFENFNSNALCLWFKPLYDTWSLWELERSRHLCTCTETAE